MLFWVLTVIGIVTAIVIQSVAFLRACRTLYLWQKRGAYRKSVQLIVRSIKRLRQHK